MDLKEKVKSWQLPATAGRRVINWEKIFVFLWLLFIPTQLGKHFWPEWSHVLGLRVDYLSPTLYFLDILWLVMVLVLQFSVTSFQLRVNKILSFKNVLIVGFILINILVAGNHEVAIYKWLRILQWWLTFRMILQNKELFKEMLMKVLPIWIIGEGLLATAQVINGGSMNGWLWWLGERRFSYTGIGVAQISYLGEGMIRAYGTFSHPNSLAGFGLVSLVLFFKNRNRNGLYWTVVFMGLLSIFLTGSRVIWALTAAIVFFGLGLSTHNWKHRLGSFLIFGGIVSLVFSLVSNNYRISDFVGGWDSDGLAKRGALIVASVKMVKDNSLFGVGAGNFLVKLPQYQQNSGVFWLQPVHNILFLILSEAGLIGLLVIAFLLFLNLNFLTNLKRLERNKMRLIILGIVVITGMFDHYWLTLPQNGWLLCVVLGIL